jgi:hypothetical protein
VPKAYKCSGCSKVFGKAGNWKCGSCGKKLAQIEVDEEVADEGASKAVVSKGVERARAAVQTEKVTLLEKAVMYAPEFKAHVFEGEADGKKHKGLHSLKRKQEGKYQLVTVAEDAAGCFIGWVKLSGYAHWKASSFFPNDWSEKKVLDSVESAYKAFRAKDGHAPDVMKTFGLHWAARVAVGTDTICIGGMGDGDKSGGITTAFPVLENQGRVDALEPPKGSLVTVG